MSLEELFWKGVLRTICEMNGDERALLWYEV